MKRSRQQGHKRKAAIPLLVVLAALVSIIPMRDALAQEDGPVDAATLQIEIEHYYNQRLLLGSVSLGTGVLGTAFGGYLLVTQDDHKRRIIGLPLLCHGLLQLAAGAMLMTIQTRDHRDAIRMMDPDYGFIHAIFEVQKNVNLLRIVELGLVTDSIVLAGSSATFLPLKPFEGWFGFAVAGTAEGLLSGALGFAMWRASLAYDGVVVRFVNNRLNSSSMSGASKPMSYRMPPIMFQTRFSF